THNWVILVMRLLLTVARSVRPSRKPQPCDFWNDPMRECRCSPLQIQCYVGRISGPLLDRIDIHIDVPVVSSKNLQATHHPMPNESGKKDAKSGFGEGQVLLLASSGPGSYQKH